MSEPEAREPEARASGSSDGHAKISAIVVDGKPAEGGVHLKREVLLAQLFPTHVARPKLGRYDVLELLGEGGMGTVYAAYDPRLDRRVAVKLLRGAGGHEEHRRARLLREAKALARLSHPHIVTIHEVWEEHGQVYLAMEFVRGQTLAQWQHPPRPWREVVAAYRQAGEGLAAAHDAGLVYRDFKPHNAIRRDDGVVKLLDFGLARLHDEAPLSPGAETLDEDSVAEPHLTRPGAIMGTPAYMAPEQHRGAPADARSDQFGFCASLWEGLYGALPFARDPEAPHGLRRVEPSREREVPGWIRRALERGLSLEPSARHPSMRALLRELGRDPAQRRRRLLGLALATGVAAIGGTLFAEPHAEPPSTCVLLHEPWDDERHEAVRSGVRRVEGEAADETLGLLELRLDHYADELREQRGRACEEHHRGLRSDAAYDLQVTCLDRHEAGFVRLVELLSSADASAVTNANKAIASLPLPAECVDVEPSLVEPPAPEDPRVAAEIPSLRQELARARMEESLGLYEQAEARAVAVLRRSEALGYAPLEAEALLGLGSAGLQAQHAEANDWLDRALWLSLATEQRRVAAEAAAKRIFAKVELGDRTTDTREAIELARSLAARTGSTDWRIRWALANNVGVALERRGERSDALASYEAALAEIPALEERSAFERAVTSSNMAPVQVRLGRAADAERSARAAVGELTALLGERHPQLDEVRGALAVVLRESGRYRAARATLAEMLAEHHTEPTPPWMMLEAARIAWRQGDLAEVRRWCEAARPRAPNAAATPSVWTLAFAAMEARVAAASGDASGLDLLRALAPRVSPPLQSMAALDRAEVLLLLGRAAAAETEVASLADDPTATEANRSTAQLWLAVALVEQGQWDAARPRLGALVAAGDRGGLEPHEHVYALLALARADAGAGRDRDARAHLAAALRALEGFDADGTIVQQAHAVATELERALGSAP